MPDPQTSCELSGGFLSFETLFPGVIHSGTTGSVGQESALGPVTKQERECFCAAFQSILQTLRCSLACLAICMY